MTCTSLLSAMHTMSWPALGLRHLPVRKLSVSAPHSMIVAVTIVSTLSGQSSLSMVNSGQHSNSRAFIGILPALRIRSDAYPMRRFWFLDDLCNHSSPSILISSSSLIVCFTQLFATQYPPTHLSVPNTSSMKSFDTARSLIFLDRQVSGKVPQPKFCCWLTVSTASAFPWLTVECDPAICLSNSLIC